MLFTRSSNDKRNSNYGLFSQILLELCNHPLIAMSISCVKYFSSPILNSFFEHCFKVRVLPFIFEVSLLFAVPKQKVTHSRKRMRMATKQLRNIQNITKCSKCGEPKLLHNLCWKCYGEFKKISKA